MLHLNIKESFYFVIYMCERIKERQRGMSVMKTLEIFIILLIFPFAIVLTLFFAFLIVLESQGGPFYSQTRLGKDGHIFKMYKLRSMYTDADKNGPLWTLANDNRITKVGRFIRKTHIDELPQLWNILKGDMSFIGPRPERPEIKEEFEKVMPNFNDRLIVKPGLTGWAQINGGYELTPNETLNYDLYYINNKCLLLDLKIMVITAKILLTGYGAR